MTEDRYHFTIRKVVPANPQTPATEAGYRHVDRCRIFLGDEALDDIIAIEGEARADALREAADTVRGLDIQPMAMGYRAAVLAILDPEP